MKCGSAHAKESRMHNDLFTIGEIAKLFHLSLSTLRHYDHIGLVSPEYTDPETGYRYYSTRQFEVLNTVRYLRELDTPLEEIGAFLKRRDLQGIRHLLLQQKAEIQKRQEELERIAHKIDHRIRMLDDAQHSQLDQIVFRTAPACRMALLRQTFQVHSPLDLEFYIRKLEADEARTAIFLGKVGIGISPAALCNRHFDAYDIMFLLLDEEDLPHSEPSLFPETPCLSVRFRGSHERAAQYYSLLMDEMDLLHLQPSGFSREITMIDSGLTSDTSAYVTEITIPAVPE